MNRGRLPPFTMVHENEMNSKDEEYFTVCSTAKDIYFEGKAINFHYESQCMGSTEGWYGKAHKFNHVFQGIAHHFYKL